MLRKGNQRPTFSTVKPWAKSDGEYAAQVFHGYGVKFFPSQEYELSVFLARNDDNSYAALTICIAKPRQNGKSFAARFYAVWMAAIEGKRVLFSAHHGKTVRKMFKEMRNFVEGTPDFAELLLPGGRGVYAAAGSEGIYFMNEDGTDGGCIEFYTRTNSAARGETYHVIVVDEAQELTDEQLEALKPTTFAASDLEDEDIDGVPADADDPQMIYLGTPPNAKCPGTVFKRCHDDSHAGTSACWWMEWAVEAVPDMTDVDAVVELVYMTNPAMGYRIKESTMREAIGTMRADGFARECLGWWSMTASAVMPITAVRWAACRIEPDSIPGYEDGIACAAVKFAPDGSSGSLAIAVNPDDGRPPYVQVIAHRSMGAGVGWFADWAAEREESLAQVVVDGKAYAGALVERLKDVGLADGQIVTPGSSDVAKACSMLVDAVESGRLSHGGQEALDDSATHSAKRKIGSGGGYGFEGVGDTDATLVEACALALWQAMTTTRDPRRVGRVG